MIVVMVGDPSQQVNAIAFGAIHSAAVTKTGELYTWGENDEGQLLGDDEEYRLRPSKVMNNVKQVSLGSFHSAVVTKAGELYTWGNNEYGQLGDGTTKRKYRPVKIMSNVKMVSLDSNCSAAVTNDGKLYTWGENMSCQLGELSPEYRAKPKVIMNNISVVNLGWDSGAAIDKSGRLYTWGSNMHGKLGDGTEEDRDLPVKVMEDVKVVSMGGTFSAAISKTGSLYTWGDNLYGQLGDGTIKEKRRPKKVMEGAKTVSCGVFHGAVVDKNGTCYTWGRNLSGALGDGTNKERHKPVKIMTNMVDVTMDSVNSAAISKTGSLYTWGENCYGQLGNGNGEPQFRPNRIAIRSATVASAASEKSNVSQLASAKELDANSSQTSVTTEPQTKTYQDLQPDTEYNFYAMKDKNSEDNLAGSNLLYIGQFATDKEGKGSITYGAAENSDKAEIFCIKGNALVQEEQTITAKSYTKTDGNKAFNLNARAKTSLTYQSDNKSVATVSSTGLVTLKAPGKATITITAASTDAYKSAVKKITVTVKPKKTILSKVSSSKSRTLKATWKRDSKATGYQVIIASNSGFTKNKKSFTATSNKTVAKTFTKLKKRTTYYVKVRAYKKVGSTKLYGDYSSYKKIKVR